MSSKHTYSVIESFYSVSGRIFIIIACTDVIPVPGTLLTGTTGYHWIIEEQLHDKKVLALIADRPYYFFSITSTDGLLRKPDIGETLTSNS
ncbi:MAG: hypothetical protein JO154_03050 [Chitinophaga sp.]|uniref:hypothetical protein n=1 Tax=Chitinophaga sp. TaxID=1869181 RepID=UPI0025BA2EE7|nr:hypothetical protein [Chitinophaga sp.]MBV8251559.1 hypothetical protein [Chitinophaga sp.]